MTYKHPLELVYNTPDLSDSDNIGASVIWMHGLGADGYDFEPIVTELALPHVRFILPHAPDRAVTINNGYVMPAWYDLYGLTADSAEDSLGIEQSQTYINELIAQEISRGILSEKIVLAGFSQGGAIALHTGLRYPKKLGGILALSTYVPLRSQIHEIHAANVGTPIFMAHGVYDEVITVQTARNSLELLQSKQLPVSWHEYPMAHSVSLDEIADIRDFLQVLVE